jgi:hypothetical protein
MFFTNIKSSPFIISSIRSCILGPFSIDIFLENPIGLMFIIVKKKDGKTVLLM